MSRALTAGVAARGAIENRRAGDRSIPRFFAFRELVGSDGVGTGLTPLYSFPVSPGGDQFGACSDGVNFWITLRGSSELARF
jgi:hypothetical protein